MTSKAIRPVQVGDQDIRRFSREVAQAIAALVNSGGIATLPSGIVILSGTATTGDMLYFDGTNWIAVHAGTTGYVLTQATGPVRPVWAAAPNGFPASPVTGDIIYYNGSAWVRLAIGTSTQYLGVSGGLPTWATPAFTSGLGIDYTIDFRTSNRDYKAGTGSGSGSAGDNPQTNPFTITANNGTSVPSTLSGGLILTPSGSAGASVLTSSSNGLRAARTTTGILDYTTTCDHLGIDRTRDFSIWLLLNRSQVTIPNGSEAGVVLTSCLNAGTPTVLMYSHHTIVSTVGVFSSEVNNFVFKISTATGSYSPEPHANAETGDDVKVSRYYGTVSEHYSLAAVAGAFPTSSSLAGAKKRGRSDAISLLNALTGTDVRNFPNDDEIVRLRVRADLTSVNCAYYAMRVVQRA